MPTKYINYLASFSLLTVPSFLYGIDLNPMGEKFREWATIILFTCMWAGIGIGLVKTISPRTRQQGLNILLGIGICVVIVYFAGQASDVTDAIGKLLSGDPTKIFGG